MNKASPSGGKRVETLDTNRKVREKYLPVRALYSQTRSKVEVEVTVRNKQEL